MYRIRLIEGFSLALLVLAFVGATASFFIAHRHVPSIAMTFLFVGLVGMLVARVLRTQQQRLERLEDELARLKDW